jgi:hypothetical protein
MLSAAHEHHPRARAVLVVAQSHCQKRIVQARPIRTCRHSRGKAIPQSICQGMLEGLKAGGFLKLAITAGLGAFAFCPCRLLPLIGLRGWFQAH